MSMFFGDWQEDGNGTWWLHSKRNPKWNASGRGFVGFLAMPPECKEKLKQLKRKYGKPPKDLEWGYMKD